jgi:hypothetical protein
MKRFGTVVSAIVAFGLSGGLAFGVNPPHAPDDHFNCYKQKDTSPKFTPVTGVTLSDVFEAATATVVKTRSTCAPANKNMEGVVDDVTHLETYSLKITAATPTAAPRTNIAVVNQFHSISTPVFVDISKGDRLLVPANKSVAPAPPPASPPDEMAINLDHYRCWRVKLSKNGQPKFVALTAHVLTQFDERDYVLKKVARLCVPVDKNAEGVHSANPDEAALLCYKAAAAKGQPKLTPATVATTDQFGSRSNLLITKAAEICVPSVQNPPAPVCGNNFQDPGEQCDGTDSPACPGLCYSDMGICTCPGAHTFSLGQVVGNCSVTTAAMCTIDSQCPAGETCVGASSSVSNARGTFGRDADLSVGPLLGSITIVTRPEAAPASGIVPLAVLPVAFPPVLFAGQNVCSYLVDKNDGSMTAGGGVIDCFGLNLGHCAIATATTCSTNAQCVGMGDFCLGAGLPPSSDLRLFQDHCTNAELAGPPTVFFPNGCNSGNVAGNCANAEFGGLPGTIHPPVGADVGPVCVQTLPPDPTCSSTFAPTGSKAVREVGHCSVTTTQGCGFGCTATSPATCADSTCPAGEVCVGHCSASTTTLCSSLSLCPAGQTCTKNQHDGVCNSPVFFIPGTGTGAAAWAAQAAFIQMNLVIKVQGATPCSAFAGKCSPVAGTDCNKNTDCMTPGDTCATGANNNPFTTTYAASGVMDYDAQTQAGTCSPLGAGGAGTCSTVPGNGFTGCSSDGVCNASTGMCTTGVPATANCSSDGVCDQSTNTQGLCTTGTSGTGNCTVDGVCTANACDPPGISAIDNTAGGACLVNSDCRVADNTQCRVANNNQCRLGHDSRCQSVGQVQALSLTGTNFSCASLLNSTTAGAKLVTSLPAPDQFNPVLSVYHDLNVGITFAAK